MPSSKLQIFQKYSSEKYIFFYSTGETLSIAKLELFQSAPRSLAKLQNRHQGEVKKRCYQIIPGISSKPFQSGYFCEERVLGRHCRGLPESFSRPCWSFSIYYYLIILCFITFILNLCNIIEFDTLLRNKCRIIKECIWFWYVLYEWVKSAAMKNLLTHK
jgi:hypothetical protein